MNNVPQKIYLQIGDKCDADDFNELSTEDITWAADKIFKNDFEYVLASDKDKEIADLKDAIKSRNILQEEDKKEIERLKGLGASFNSDAVKFAEWILKEGYYTDGSAVIWFDNFTHYTTQELYNLFLANKNSIQQAHDNAQYE